ncbi:MAG: hypothetical protein ABIH23_32235 [bacterium]
MPGNVVKTKADERHWRMAIKAYADAMRRGETITDEYAYKMGTFRRIKKNAQKGK